MLIDALVLAVAVGYLRGGRLKNLEKIELHAEVLMVAALVIQLLTPWLALRSRPFSSAAFSVWLLSFAMLLLAMALNRDRAALVVAGAGVAMNLIVVALNGGMPVLVGALNYLTPHEKITAASFAGDPLHHLASSVTRLPFLADAVPIPWPSFQRGVASVGDIFLMAGVFWLVQDGMKYVGKRRITK